MAYRMDYFRGTEAQVLPLLGDKIKYPAFAIIRDSEESSTCRLAFVNQENELEYIRDANGSSVNCEKQIVNLDALPDVSEAKNDVLYIVGEVVYLFNGTEFKSINSMNSSEVAALTGRVEDLEEAMKSKVTAEEVETKINEKVDAAVEDAVEAKVDAVIDEKVSASVDDNEKVMALESANQELMQKVAKLEEAVEALENDTPVFVELE